MNQHDDEYRDRISTVTQDGKRKHIFAEKPKGKFYTRRGIVSLIYFALFFGLPFWYINGRPAFLFNFAEAKFIVLGKIFWPQDFFILALGMIIAILFIALFTVTYGRIFCGWICPQTVFLEMLFRKVEWWIEGSRNAQMKRARDGKSAEDAVRAFSKHVVFTLLSLIIAHTFLAYIFGLKELRQMISEPASDHVLLLGGLLLFTLLFYGVFAFVREITCTAICPYGRLQAVLFDRNTLQIAYDEKRGEPRGKINATTGDCIDCNKCVHVCPMGIDIRNGLQIECTACTACIDACNVVMEKIGKPKGLIRYASEHEMKTGQKVRFSNRMKAYSAVLLVLCAAMITLIATNKNVAGHISRVKGQLFQEPSKDSISNLFNIEVLNKTEVPVEISLRVRDLHGSIKWVSAGKAVAGKESVKMFTFFLVLPKSEVTKRKSAIKMDMFANGEKAGTIKTTFLGPFN